MHSGNNKSKEYKKAVRYAARVFYNYPHGTELKRYVIFIVVFLLIGAISFSLLPIRLTKNVPLSLIAGRYSFSAGYSLAFALFGAFAAWITSKIKK